MVPHEPAPTTVARMRMALTLRGTLDTRFGGDLPRILHVNNAAVLVPVKAFRAAKLRLAPALDAAARAELARVMATRVDRGGGSVARLGGV